MQRKPILLDVQVNTLGTEAGLPHLNPELGGAKLRQSDAGSRVGPTPDWRLPWALKLDCPT